MPLDATSRGALLALLETIFEQEILDTRQIIACARSASPKGLSNVDEPDLGFSNACYINAGLMFLFETIRLIPDLKLPWESFVYVVLHDPHEIEFVKKMCQAYEDLYYTMKNTVKVTGDGFKVKIDELLPPDSKNYGTPGTMQGDSKDFINLFSKQFGTQSRNQLALEPMRRAWKQVFPLADHVFQPISCFDFEGQCDQKFVMTIVPINDENYKFVQTIVNTSPEGGHFIFIKRYGDKWILYDDGKKVKFYDNFPHQSYYHYGLNLYERIA